MGSSALTLPLLLAMPPEGDLTAPGRALVFDSTYDQYRGVVAFVRVVDGSFRTGQWVRSMGTENRLHIEEIGVMTPAMLPTQTLSAGDVGYIVTGIKSVSEIRVGDTLTDEQVPASEPLPGYVDVKPMVFAGLFPTDADGYQDLRDALEKLSLNDASLVYEPETSQALGFGFRCGFLGLLHMDIVRERLERDSGLELLATTPNVEYHVRMRGDVEVDVHSPTEMPDPNYIEAVEEPYIRASIISPPESWSDWYEVVRELAAHLVDRFGALKAEIADLDARTALIRRPQPENPDQQSLMFQ